MHHESPRAIPCLGITLHIVRPGSETAPKIHIRRAAKHQGKHVQERQTRTARTHAVVLLALRPRACMYACIDTDTDDYRCRCGYRY